MMSTYLFLSLLLLATILPFSLAESQISYRYSYYYYHDSCNAACLFATITFVIVACCCCTGCVIIFLAALAAFIIKFAYSQGKSKGKTQQQLYNPQQQPVVMTQYYPGYPHPVQTTTPINMGQVQYPPPPPAQ
ncbi:hypothetical protein LOD99_14680 [Oopsacas minuta]|uniref:Uncharacterized protein n=1 Tax=Oopsacas minuta TaxID=111878 RepID=A0AAV7KEF7_9METZ|nr:hypothetical protein LOD99_14680 [Oopsacas minuta]